MKTLFYTTILLAFLSCQQKEQTAVDKHQDAKTNTENKKKETKVLPTPQLLFNTPWIDHSILLAAEGC